MSTRSSRRRKSENQADVFMPPDPNITLGGVNTRRRNMRKQNENDDINSDTSSNMDFVTPKTKLMRKRQTDTAIKQLKLPKSESKTVLKEMNQKIENVHPIDKKIDLGVNDCLDETKNSLRKSTRGRKKQIQVHSEVCIPVQTKKSFSAEKLGKNNRKRKNRKTSRENDSSSDETLKESQSTKVEVNPAKPSDHAIAEHVLGKKIEKECTLDISAESFHSAAGGSLIDSAESPEFECISNVSEISLKQSLNELSPIQALSPIKKTIADNLVSTSDKSLGKRKKSVNTRNKTGSLDILNITFDKSIEGCETSPTMTNQSMLKIPKNEIEHVLNTTFEKSAENKKTPLGKSRRSRVTVGSPDLLNTSPFLVDDSLLQDDNEDVQETSKMLTVKSTSEERYSSNLADNSALPKTPLRKEGTFTMDSCAQSKSSSTDTIKQNGDALDSEDSDLDKTPENNHRTMSLPGSTPYHRDTRSNANNSRSNKSILFNITHSIEKDKSDGRRRSSSAQPKSTIKTRVAFCSPAPNPARKESQGVNKMVIKSSLKGSNKSFVYKEADNEKRGSRKRSLTCNDANDSQLSKRRCMTQSELNTSVNRLSKPRTPGSQVKRLSPLSNSMATTPSKTIKIKAVSETKPKSAPESKSKAHSEKKIKTASETKQLSRSRLPNFAALHKKNFDKMESLHELQERKAKRAVHLLNSPKVATLSKNLFGILDGKKKQEQELTMTTNKSNSYNRFGFKNPPNEVFSSVPTNTTIQKINARKNADANIFSIPTVSEAGSQKDNKANIFSISTTAPKPETKLPTKRIFASRVDSGLSQKDKSRQVLMRERNTESVLAKNKKDSRDFIRGVRTNRRFELQMKQRNLNG